jgi:hypothetical protein
VYRTGVSEAVGKEITGSGVTMDSALARCGSADVDSGRIECSVSGADYHGAAVTDKITNKAKQISFECIAESDTSRQS